MSKLINAIDWAGKGLDVISRWSLVVTMVLFIANIFIRGLGLQFLGAYEWVGFLLVLVNGFSQAYSNQQNGHVSIDLFTAKLPAGGQKILDIIVSSICTVFLFFVSIQIFLYAGSLAAAGQVSMTSEIPVAPFVYALSVGFLLFSLSFLVKVLKTLGAKEAAKITEDNTAQLSS